MQHETRKVLDDFISKYKIEKQEKSSSASNSLVISQGKSKEALDSLHISQRSIKVGNISQDLSIQQLENLFTDNRIEGIESIHIPMDNLGFQFGFLFITFNSSQYFEDFCSKIDDNSTVPSGGSNSGASADFNVVGGLSGDEESLPVIGEI
ncbi:unnamed protein product [Rotaria sp. Silwood2]|nr:unnamed protein product [Rotaria sp. Silwood2]